MLQRKLLRTAFANFSTQPNPVSSQPRLLYDNADSKASNGFWGRVVMFGVFPADYIISYYLLVPEFMHLSSFNVCALLLYGSMGSFFANRAQSPAKIELVDNGKMLSIESNYLLSPQHVEEMEVDEVTEAVYGKKGKGKVLLKMRNGERVVLEQQSILDWAVFEEVFGEIKLDGERSDEEDEKVDDQRH